MQQRQHHRARESAREKVLSLALSVSLSTLTTIKKKFKINEEIGRVLIKSNEIIATFKKNQDTLGLDGKVEKDFTNKSAQLIGTTTIKNNKSLQLVTKFSRCELYSVQ